VIKLRYAVTQNPGRTTPRCAAKIMRVVTRASIESEQVAVINHGRLWTKGLALISWVMAIGLAVFLFG
jgi:hypothetical protein